MILRSTLCLLTSLLLVLSLGTGCRRGPTDKDLLASYEQAQQPMEEPIVQGYNTPVVWSQNVGLRAVAKGGLLFLSVDNRSNQEITIGPKSFRLILPEGTFAFEEPQCDLSGFPIRKLHPTSKELFTVRVSQFEDLADYSVVMQYPPTGLMIRVFIEPTDP